MSLVYTKFDYHGVMDSDYHRYPYFSYRASVLEERWRDLKDERFLIAGCGWGFLVDELRDRGFDAWGCDASTYAVEEAAPRELPRESSERVLWGNVLDEKSMASVVERAGGYFRAVVTEDVLPCLTLTGELERCLAALRSISSEVLHIISPLFEVRSPRLVHRPLEEWDELLEGTVISGYRQDALPLPMDALGEITEVRGDPNEIAAELPPP